MFTVVDFILAIVCLFFLLRGLFRGLLMEFFSILALIAAFLASINYYPVAAEWFSSLFPPGASRNAAGLIAVFAVVWLLIKLLSWMLNRNLGEAESNPLFRVSGGALALVKAVLFLSLVIYLSGRIWPENRITTGNLSTELSEQVVERLKDAGLFPELPDLSGRTPSSRKYRI
jgi:membrane protein required for colicin V production